MRALILVTVLLLAACGQSGDLYLPDQRPAAEGGTPAAEPAASEENKDRK